MSKGVALAVLFFFVSLLWPDFLLSEQIIIDSDEQFHFAKRLMERREYQLAVAEFERFIHFFPNDDKAPKARCLVGVCYLHKKEYESARKVFADVCKIYPDSAVAEQALFLIGESYYKQSVQKEARRYFKMVLDQHPEPGLTNAATYRIGWSYMHANKWRDASEAFTLVEESSPLYASSQDLSRRSQQGEDLPRKHPTAAGVAAAIIPGLGHAYCSRYRDALISFLLNGLFIWAAAESFDQDHDILGGILGFLETGWYSGNIYSAVNCAHKHNRRVRDNYRKSLSDNLDLELFTTSQVYPALALKIRF
ncbi:MAG: tetratricopeptide repeat protein [Thermodesulfobacteriota bacterium]|nr:tetratricopeptide repeat protein [Thermodesulfobacteriota bacterium]